MAWAFVLGLLLILIAISTADAATLARGARRAPRGAATRAAAIRRALRRVALRLASADAGYYTYRR